MGDEPEVITDYLVLGVGPQVELEDPQFAQMLDDMAMRAIVRQYDKPPKAVMLVDMDWILTSDWREVERFQPAHHCAACIAGNDQAVAFLKEFPDKRLALCNMQYIEVW